MVDDKFRSYRNRDFVARREVSRPRARVCWLRWLGSLAKVILTLMAAATARLPRLTTAIPSRGREASRPRAGE
jgi:hypothetical protein